MIPKNLTPVRGTESKIQQKLAEICPAGRKWVGFFHFCLRISWKGILRYAKPNYFPATLQVCWALLLGRCFRDKSRFLRRKLGVSWMERANVNREIPRHGTCTCHFCICMSLCNIAGFEVLIILKFSFNASNSIFMVRISLFNWLEFSHPRKTLTWADAVRHFPVFSQPGSFNLRSSFKVYYWCLGDINACMQVPFPWCFKIIFGKGIHTLHPASVINVQSHLEFLTWPKLCPVNWFHGSKFGAKTTMKTLQCFIITPPAELLLSFVKLIN